MPRKSVAVCQGQGQIVKVVKGQLVIDDHGITTCYPRAGHGLARIIVIGRSGSVSLAAYQWCSHLGIPIVVIRPDGMLLSTSTYGPDGLGVQDGRLIRAQATASGTPVEIAICRMLLTEKISLSANIAETQLENPELAEELRNHVDLLDTVNTVAELRGIEGSAADAYFKGWRNVTVRFCSKEISQLPARWPHFNGRSTRVGNGGTNRRASNPINAILNYVYTVAASECRLACVALGLEPKLGFLHSDEPNREGLVWDLIEVVRPIVESWVLALVKSHVFEKDDFTETEVGSCRLAETLTHCLASTGPLWFQGIAPFAEAIRNMIADSSPYPISKSTRLTSSRLRSAKGLKAYPSVTPQAQRAVFPKPHTCKTCANQRDTIAA